MKPRRRSFFWPVVGCVLLGVLIFAFSLWYLLPYDALARWAEGKLADKGAVVRIEGIHPAFFPTVEADAVEIESYGSTPLGLRLGTTRVTVSLGELLGGKMRFRVRSESFGGTIDADVPLQGGLATTSWRDVELDGLTERIPGIALPIGGKSNGRLEVETPVASLTRLTGRIEADLLSVSLGPGAVMGMAVSPVSLGSGSLDASSEEGRLDVRTFHLAGGDMEASFDGSVRIGPSLPRSGFNGTLTLKPTAAIEMQYPLIFNLIQSQKTSSGAYALRIEGSFAAPRLRGAGATMPQAQ